MKNTIKKIISLLLVTFMVFGSAPLACFVGLELPELKLFGTKAEAYVSYGVFYYTYNTSTQTATITGATYDCTGDVEIPSYFGDFRVTAIAEKAFYNRKGITSIKLPYGVKSIGSQAFSMCSNLTSVTLNSQLSSIGSQAFSHCNSLTNITIPDSVSSISNNAFQYCNSLASIVVNPGNTMYSSDEYGVLFNKDKTVLIRYPEGNANINYVIPDSVKNISDYAFYCCDNLTSITIPDSVTSIGNEVFCNCDNLVNIAIPDSVICIGNDAFSFCDSLASITISDSVKNIGESAFRDCDSIVSVIIPDSVTNICDFTFYDCSSLTGITISDNLTNIGDYAFGECSNITDIYYSGTNLMWNAISIGTHNEPLFNADIHYNHVHTTNIVKEDVDSTCTDKGHKIYACICGYFITQKNPELGHDIVIDKAVEATCTETGLTEGQHCTRCDDMTVEQEIIPAINHKDTLVNVEAKMSTCTEIGWDAYEFCTACDYTTYVEKGALDHDIIIDKAVESTCTETGLTEGQHCSRCDDMTVEQEVVPVKNHDIIIDEAVEATCTETGLTEGQHCSRCDDMTIEQAVVPVKGHDIIIDEAVESTCTETGLTEGQHCSRCDEMTIEQEVVPVKGHDIIIDDAVDSTCTKAGLTEGLHCSRCDEMTIEQEIVPIKPYDHTVKYDSANHWKECVCGSIIEKQNHSFIGGNTCECGFKRIVNSTIKIKNNNGSKTINYGETLQLTAIVTDKPADAKIYWCVNGVKKGEGETFNITFESGTMIVEVKLVDENGVVYQDTNGNEISDSENVTVNNGFFQKIISFFKNLFGMNRIVVQSIFKDTF